MKKFTILTFLMAFLAAAFLNAQNAPVSTIATVNSNLASTIVPITATNFTNITGGDLRIIYNSSIVTATNLTTGPGLGGLISTNLTVPGLIVISWFTFSPGTTLPDNSVIFNITFSKVTSGTASISFDDNPTGKCKWGSNGVILNDSPASSYYIGGSLTLGNAPVTKAPVITACPGTTISVPVTVTNFDNIGQVYALRMLYNSPALTYQSFTNNSGFPGLTVNGATPGVITVPPSGQSAPGISYPANTVLFTLNFTYNGGYTALSWSEAATGCLYRGPAPYTILNDTPTSTFYIDGYVEQLVAPAITRNPTDASVCISTPVSATFSAGSGGVSPVDLYESSIDAGNNWLPYTPGTPLTAATAGTAQIQVRSWRTSTGTSCTNSGYVTTSWDVVALSAGGTLTGDAVVCSGTNSSLLSLAGYFGNIVKWQSSPDGNTWTDFANTFPTYTATDLVATTHYRAVVQNGICSPANSNEVIVTVNPILPVSITIAASANPTCTGSEITYTATPVNGGASPSFQWALNGLDVPGATNPAYSYVPVNADFLTCTLTSSEVCKSGSPALSNQVTMTVNPLPVVNAASMLSSLNPVGPWSPVNGDLPTGYNMCIDPEIEFYYLDLNAMTTTQPLLADNLNPFSVDQGNLPATWLSYWAGRGVNGPTGNQYPWQDQMWQIIHGNAPIFYIYYTTGGDYQLIDGLIFQLGGGLTPLRLSGDYPQWNYSYSGTIKDVNNCISSFFDVYLELNTIPAVTAAALQSAVNPAGPWGPVSGELATGYDMCIDPAVEFYYLDINTLAASQPLLPDFLNPFTVEQSNLPPTWLAYWAGRGVNGPTGNQYPWQDQMWQIIHGNAPIFYINYTPGGDYQLIDGLTYQLGGGLTPLRVSGDYPQWNYQYSGTVTDVNNCISSFFDVFLELNTIPVVTGATVQSATSQAGPWSPVNGDLVAGYSMCIDPAIQFYYLDVNTLSATQPLLTNNLNPFTLDQASLPANWLAYWASKGVNGPIGNQFPWQDQMWNIIHGTDPIFYVNYTDGGDYQLIDGLAYQMGEGEIPLRLFGDYPQWNYTYSGSVIDEHYCPSSFFDIYLELFTIPSVNPIANQTYCSGETSPEVVLTATVPGTTFAWTNSNPGIGLQASGTGNIPSFVTTNSGPGSISGIITVTPTSNGCSGAPVDLYTIAVNPLMPVGVSIAADENPVCAGTTVTFTATAINGGTAPTYKWFVNAVEVSGATDVTYAYAPVTGDAISCEVTSNEVCATGSPATSAEVTMTVNPLMPVSITVAASANPVCAGTNVTFTATAINSGTAPTYKWFVNTTEVPGATDAAYAYIPLTGEAITCEVTSNEVCATGSPATSAAVTMTVNPLMPVSITVAASANPVCAGTNVTFTATAINGGSAPTYKWFVNAVEVSGATDVTYAYVPLNGDAVTCEVTSSEVCTTGSPATSTAVIMTVNPLMPVSITVAASANPVCEGTNVTFTATAINGGLAPTYKWFVNAVEVSGATDVTYAYVPLNGDAITCDLTSNEVCATGSPATSAAVTMTVNPLMPVSISVSAGANPVCAGTNVTFTATAINGGSAPTYKWFVNAVEISGATGVTYAYAPLNGDAINCEVTSSEVCATGSPATSAAVTMTVNPLMPVSVTVAASANPVCAGTNVTFTATAINGGTAPTYKWFVNAVEVSGATGVTYAYVPLNGDAITCELTSNEVCATGSPATSAAVTMSVNSLLPVSVSVAASANPICAGTPVTFTATATNGGSSPAYKWYVNTVEVSGATDVTYAYAPLNGDAINCEVTSSAVCTTGNPATSATVTITVNPLLPVSVSVAASVNPACAGTAVTFTATPINGGSSPTYKWYVNTVEVSGATGVSYVFVPLNNDAVTCKVSSSAVCATGNPATSAPVIMTVNPLMPVSVTVDASENPVCEGTVVTFSASPVNGGTAPTFKWFVNTVEVSGATDVTYVFAPLNGDAIVCEVTSNAVCATGNPATSAAVTMTVNPMNMVSVTVTPSVNPVYEGTSVTFNTLVTNGGSAPTFKWFVNTVEVPGATDASYVFIPANNDAVACMVTSNVSCSSGNPATSNTVIMTVDPNLPVSVTIVADANPVCAGSQVTFTATPVNGGSSPAYQWVVNTVPVTGATGVTYSYVPASGDAVKCILTSSLEHTTGNPATSNTITMALTPKLSVMIFIAASANPVCAGIPVTFSSVPINGGTAPAYQWIVNSAVVAGATNPTYTYTPAQGDAITCSLTSSETCTMVNPVVSNMIGMTVNPLQNVSVTISAGVNPVCTGTPVNFSATPVNGGTLPGYQWKVNGSDVSGATNAVYAYTPVNNDVITCVLTSNINCASGNPATSNAVTMTVNPIVPVSVTIAAGVNPVCSGIAVTFTATPVNGGSTPGYQWKVNSANVPGATSSTYSYVPSNNDAVACILTSSAGCTSGNPAASNTIIMGVNAAPVPTITGSTVVCPGPNMISYNTEVGMSNYLWTISAGGTIIAGSTGSTVIVTWNTSGNQWLKVNYTNGSGCSALTPAQYNVTVNPLPVVSLSGATTVCAGATGIVYSTDAGMSNYSWSISSGGTITSGGTFTSNTMTVSWSYPSSQWVKVNYTNGNGCAASGPARLDVMVNYNGPASVSVVPSANPVDAGTLVTFTATAVNGGATPAYLWKVNGSVISGATNSTYAFVPLNNDAVQCMMTSSLSCVSGSPANSNTVLMTVNGIPLNLIVQNVTVANLQTECYNALDTILVAGGITTFVVENGGTANFIAGKAIRYLPGTRVDLGGTMTGKIAPAGPFCGGAMPPVVAAVVTGVEPSPVILDQAWFTIYPNPTSGNFTLVQKGNKAYGNVRVEIFTMTGERVLHSTLTGEKRHEFNLSEVPNGLYFVKIIGDNFTETIKLIRTK